MGARYLLTAGIQCVGQYRTLVFNRLLTEGQQHFRNDIATNVMAAFENKCLHCGGNSDLTLDHFALPKNEGGNFVLWVKDDGMIRLNVVVLCRSCNSAKGELSHIDFFAPEKQSQAIACQGRLLEFVLASEPTLRVIKRWYRST